MTKDEDVATFLRYSGTYMDVNGLGPDWENTFIRGIQKLKNKEQKNSFKRGFAKSVLGALA